MRAAAAREPERRGGAMAAAGDPCASYDAVLVSNAGMRARDGTWLATDV